MMYYQEQVAFMGNNQWENQGVHEECFFSFGYEEVVMRQNTYNPKDSNFQELDIGAMFKAIMENQVEHQRETDMRFNEFRTQLDRATSTVKVLEDQMDHIASLSTSSEFCDVITLRSGKELPTRERPNIEKGDETNGNSQKREARVDKGDEQGQNTSSTNQATKRKLTFVPPPYEPKVPFPGRVKKQLLEKQKKRFMDIVDDVMITIPLLEAIEDNPIWKKFFKDLVTKKNKIEEIIAMVSQESSSTIQESCPQKQKDPGSFTLPCSIGDAVFPRSLCDLGSSVNLMPLSIATKLGVTEFKPSGISLLLADRSVRIPIGVVEDLPLKVGTYQVPTDFVVLRMDKEPSDPLILGRPFLATTGALIDVKRHKIGLQLGGKIVDFDLQAMMKKPTIGGELFGVEINDMLEGEMNEELLIEDPSEIAPTIEKRRKVEVPSQEEATSRAIDSMFTNKGNMFKEETISTEIKSKFEVPLPKEATSQGVERTSKKKNEMDTDAKGTKRTRLKQDQNEPHEPHPPSSTLTPSPLFYGQPNYTMGYCNIQGYSCSSLDTRFFHDSTSVSDHAFGTVNDTMANRFGFLFDDPGPLQDGLSPVEN